MGNTKRGVKCGVESCRYNKNRTCHAQNAEVSPKAQGRAEASEEISCSSFKKK